MSEREKTETGALERQELTQIISAIKTKDLEFLRAIEQAAHDLICWTHQSSIDVEPDKYSRHVKDLHPSVFNTLNSAEQQLYNALMRRKGALPSKENGATK